MNNFYLISVNNVKSVNINYSYVKVFLALIGLAAAAPQAIMPYSYGIMPYTSHITPYMHPGMMPVNSGIMGIMPKMIIPGIMTPDILKPVDDTPEVWIECLIRLPVRC